MRCNQTSKNYKSVYAEPTAYLLSTTLQQMSLRNSGFPQIALRSCIPDAIAIIFGHSAPEWICGKSYWVTATKIKSFLVSVISWLVKGMTWLFEGFDGYVRPFRRRRT